MAEEKLTLPQPDYNLQERIRQDSVDINPIDLSMPYEDFTKYLPDNENLVDDQYRRSVAEYTQFLMKCLQPPMLIQLWVQKHLQ